MQSRGSVTFDALTSPEYMDLVQETLDESDFIETSRDGDRIILHEVTE